MASEPREYNEPNSVDENTVEISVDLIHVGESPRLAGHSSEHARLLAETDAALPPIVLHRATMRIVDGAHRLEAARIRGDETIRARFFDGDDEAAFVFAVEANVAHGLPLSLGDRKAAALRIVWSYPHWSDRAIALKVGLTHKTVGTIRRESTGEFPQSRIGRDGKIRPVRTRSAALAPREQHQAIRETDWVASLHRLRSDPSLRYTHAGRTVLHCLNIHEATIGQWDSQVAEMIPEHSLAALADFALKCAADWQRFHSQLDRRRERR